MTERDPLVEEDEEGTRPRDLALTAAAIIIPGGLVLGALALGWRAYRRRRDQKPPRS